MTLEQIIKSLESSNRVVTMGLRYIELYPQFEREIYIAVKRILQERDCEKST